MREFCLAKAAECEDAAMEAGEPHRRDWLLMALEWRIASSLPPELEHGAWPPPRRA